MKPQKTQASSAAASMAFQAPRQAPDHGKSVQGKPDAFLGMMDMTAVDTTPGARCALAPPPGLDLTPGDYRDLMRLRYRTSPAHRQHMRIYARRIGYTPCVGPWAAEARKILGAIGP
jgi:hypothetical protein